jgi:hypothetical protein
VFDAGHGPAAGPGWEENAGGPNAGARTYDVQIIATRQRSATLAFFGFAELGDDGEVFEGGDVALDFAVGGQFAEEAAHDLAAAGFGKSFGEADVVGTGEGADFLGDPLAQFVFQFAGGLVAGLKRYEGRDGLAFEIVGATYDCGFSDFGVCDEGRFDFHGTETVSADIDDIIDAPHQPEIAIGIHARTVAGEVAAGYVGPVGLLEALGIAVDGASHGRPRFPDDEKASATGGDGMEVAVLIGPRNDFRLNTEEGARGGARLGGNGARNGRNHDGPGLSLPPGIDDGAAIVADLFAVPHP